MSEQTSGTIKVCPADGAPVMFTFEHPGCEYLCVACGWRGDIFGPLEADATDDLATRRDEVLAEWCGGDAVGEVSHDGPRNRTADARPSRARSPDPGA